MKKIFALIFVLFVTLIPQEGLCKNIKYKVTAQDDTKKQIVEKIIQAFQEKNLNLVNTLDANQDLGKITIQMQSQEHENWAWNNDGNPIDITLGATPFSVALELYSRIKKKDDTNVKYSTKNAIIKYFFENCNNLFKEYSCNSRGETFQSRPIKPIEVLVKNKDNLDLLDAVIDRLIKDKKIDAFIDDNNNTLLNILCSDDANITYVEKLINAGASLEIANKDGIIPLSRAISEGNSRKIKEKILDFLSIKYENSEYDLTKTTQTPWDKYSLFKILWDYGAEDIQIRAFGNIAERVQLNKMNLNEPLDDSKNTLLHYLVAGGNQNENLDVEKLIETLNSYNITMKNFNIEAKNSSGQTPLDVAVQKNQSLWVRFLLQHDAKINDIDIKAQKVVGKIKGFSTPKNWGKDRLIVENLKDILELLIQYGAKKNEFEQQIKESHEYKNWGQHAQNNLNEIIQLINNTQPDPIKIAKLSSSGATPPSSPSTTPPSSPKPGKKKKDPLTKSLSTLSKKLSELKQKLGDLAAKLNGLATGLGKQKP